jgi:hypothetical protein
MEEKLYNEGLKSIAMISAAEPEMLSAIQGVGEKSATQWIEAAIKIIDEETAEKKSS